MVDFVHGGCRFLIVRVCEGRVLEFEALMMQSSMPFRLSSRFVG